jgi:DNA-binding response OmpR family regulator
MARVLVIEDDPDIAELIHRYLHKAGFDVDVLTSGRDALQSIRAQVPSLIVLDLMLPHVDGLDICRMLRAEEATASIPIIMVTARAEES